MDSMEFLKGKGAPRRETGNDSNEEKGGKFKTKFQAGGGEFEKECAPNVAFRRVNQGKKKKKQNRFAQAAV